MTPRVVRSLQRDQRFGNSLRGFDVRHLNIEPHGVRLRPCLSCREQQKKTQSYEKELHTHRPKDTGVGTRFQGSKRYSPKLSTVRIASSLTACENPFRLAAWDSSPSPSRHPGRLRRPQEGIADNENTPSSPSHGRGRGMLRGRVTYETMKGYWPAVARGDEEALAATREWGSTGGQAEVRGVVDAKDFP